MAHVKGLSARTVVFALILAFYGSLLLHKIDLPAADDLPRHIQNGAMLLQGNTDVLYRNVYSYTEGDYALRNHHWLSGVIFYGLHQLVGFDGLVVFKVLVLVAGFALLFAASLKKADFWLVAALAIPSILILRERTELRPEIFSYFLIAVFLYLLLDLEEHPQHRRIFWLIPIQVLWVNLHIFSSIGIALVAVFLLEKVRDPKLNRKLSLLLIGVIVATLINPYGPGIFYVFHWAINANKDFPLSTMEEYSVPDFLRFSTLGEDISVAVFLPLAVLMLISFIPVLKKKPVFYFLAGVSTIVVAYSRLRGFAFFGMMALPIISANLNGMYVRLRERIRPAALIVSVACLIVIAVQGRLTGQSEFGIGLTAYSDSSSAFLQDNKIRGPVFNDPDIGSYLIGALYPQEKVFVDNRFADAYPPSFFRDTYLPLPSDESKWQEAVTRYGFNAIVGYPNDGMENFRSFLRRRIYDPAWSFVYVDPYAFVLLRNTEVNRETIQKFAITPKNIRQRMQNLIQSENPREQVAAADVFNIVGMPDEALEIFSNVIQRWPERRNLWLVMGQTELAKGQNSNPAQALAYLSKAMDAGYKTAQTYALMGSAYSQLGEKEKAVRNLQQALRFDPSRNDVKELLERIRN